MRTKRHMLRDLSLHQQAPSRQDFSAVVCRDHAKMHAANMTKKVPKKASAGLIETRPCRSVSTDL